MGVAKFNPWDTIPVLVPFCVEIMSITIVPAKKQHAIELAVFALDLVQVPPDRFAQFCEEVKKIDSVAEHLPSVRPINHISLHVENSTTSVMSDQGGFEFHDSQPGTASKWSLSVNRDFAAVLCFDYDRWGRVKNKALEFLIPVFQLLKKHSIELNSVTLQYVDSFEVLGASKKQDAAAAVLNIEGSEYFSPMLRVLPDFWHIHQGWFDVSEFNSKLLNTLNVDFGSSDGRDIVKVHGIHKNTLTVFSENSKINLEREKVESVFDELHQLNKMILNSILSEESKKKIALNSEGA